MGVVKSVLDRHRRAVHTAAAVICGNSAFRRLGEVVACRGNSARSPLPDGRHMSEPNARTIPCPNCRNQMQSQSLQRHDHGVVEVDLCFACAGFWFDHGVSVQLAPAAVIDLFKEIYAHRGDARQPTGNQLNCPRCHGALVLSFDLSKSGRFSYFACHRGDGRFTPFFQFLREKQFVRSLTPGELQQVRSQVRQITCSGCGAPIDLEHETQCKYCHAPVSFLDPGAVEKALQMWSDAAGRRAPGATPPAAGEPPRIQGAAPAGWPQAHLAGQPQPRLTEVHDPASAAPKPDLVSQGIHAIGRLIDAGS